MAAKPVKDRMRRQRELRALEGWQEVKVWVPTQADADDIRNLAAKRRAKAEALHGLSEETKTVTNEREIRIAQAIAEHGSAAYITPSGPILTLMTELADEDDLIGFSRAVIILARAKPANAAFVTAAVPAKITNFLIKHRGIDANVFFKWSQSHPEYVERLTGTIRNPERFSSVVEAMAQEIKDWASRH